MPLDPLDLAAIGGDLSRLADLLRRARLQLPGTTRDQFDIERDGILLTWDGYLEPRIGAPDAPIVAAIVGASGVGKSTLLNSIAGRRISAASVVRPTTVRPMVWADSSHPDDYWTGFSDRAGKHLGERIDAQLDEHPLTEHLTVIDTPPLDRYGPAEVAAQAVALSDLCIFVTTPTRYADGLAWDFLRRTRSRGIPMLFVLNRLPPDLDEQAAILGDFAHRLHQRELLAAPDPSLLFGLGEGPIDARREALEPDAVSSIRKELAEVADPVYRSGLVDETVYATARMVAERARVLTRPMAAEQPIVATLLESVASAYERQAAKLDTELRAGLLGSEVSGAAWPEVAADISAIVTRRAGAAAHASAAAWAGRAESAMLVDVEAPELWRHGPRTTHVARMGLESWKAGLEALAQTHARPGRLRWFGSAGRAVSALWLTALGMASELPRRVQRKFEDDGDEVLATARAELSDALRAGLAADAARFTQFLGSESEDDLYASIVDRADLVDARLDGLAGQIPSAWAETPEDFEILNFTEDRVVSIEIEGGSTVIELGGDNGVHNRNDAFNPLALPEAEVVLEDGL